MKVTIQKFEHVELDADVVQEVFTKRLDQLCGGEHVYIDDKTGKVMVWEDTGHGSGLTAEVKNPSSRQIAALKFRDELTKIRHAEQDAEEKDRKKKAKKSA